MPRKQIDRTIWYAIFGAPGTGKSLLLERLTSDFPHLERIDTESSDDSIVKVGSTLNKYHSEIFEKGNYDYFFKFQMESLPQRFIKSHNCENYSCIDDTIYDAYAYALAEKRLEWISEDEYNTFFANYALLRKLYNKPNTVIFLQCVDTHLIVRNLINRGRVIDRKFPIEYISSLLDSFNTVADELRKNSIRVLPYNISNFPNDTSSGSAKINNELYQKILEKLNPISSSHLEYLEESIGNSWSDLADHLEISESDRKNFTNKHIHEIYEWLKGRGTTFKFCKAITEVVSTFNFNLLRDH